MKLCIDCKQPVANRSKTTKWCFSCYNAMRKRSYCVDCGTRLRHSSNTRCIKCFGKYNSGSNHSSWKGGLPDCLECGQKLSVYRGSNQYDTGFCQECYRGERTKRWNPALDPELREHGRTLNPAYHQWRRSVFDRDDFTCRKCQDDKGGNLVAHHIYNFTRYPTMRTDRRNGVTLCEPCHKNFHKEYSYTNNDIHQLWNYLGTVS
jgi:5-methylcytosine-specific restriction endonuclease McrA